VLGRLSADKYSLITIFLYMVAELSALQQIVNALTGLNGLPVVIVQCAITTIYTCTSTLPSFNKPNHLTLLPSSRRLQSLL
jgi:Na+/proline symporter